MYKQCMPGHAFWGEGGGGLGTRIYISIMTLPSVRIVACREVDVLSHDLDRARRVVSQSVTKIATNPEPCIALLLEKLRK